jgi:hypothetical protein
LARREFHPNEDPFLFSDKFLTGIHIAFWPLHKTKKKGAKVQKLVRGGDNEKGMLIPPWVERTEFI